MSAADQTRPSSDPRPGAIRFRIERREVLEQRREEKKRLTAPLAVSGKELTIGTRSSCGLVLDDPIAAERHCAITFEGGNFVLRDLENATGTYINGMRLERPTALDSGDRVALGVTILELSIDRTAVGTLIVGVHEGAFFHTVKKRGEFQSDADEWVRSEVRFGRTPRLRFLNATAGAVGLLGAGWLAFAATGRAALQPGPLAAHHAALFAGIAPADPAFGFTVDIAREQGCAACHEGSGRPGVVTCGKCHSDLVGDALGGRAHPFGDASDALACVECHHEHHGATPPAGAVTPTEASSLCTTCHGDTFREEAGLLAGLSHAATTYALAPASDAKKARLVSEGYEAFDHGAHGALDCAKCHVQSDAVAGLDFGLVPFERCMDCHSEQSTVAEAERPQPDHRWSTSWHGVGEDGANCRLCHVEPYDAALTRVERAPAVAVAFALAVRSHDEFHHGLGAGGPAGPGDCNQCHKSGELLTVKTPRAGRPFRHDQHLSSLAPHDDAARALVNGQCTECHREIATSMALVASPSIYTGPAVEACTTCHEDGGRALITAAGTAIPAPTNTPPSTVAFPHDRHMGVEGSCVACHEFTRSGSMSVNGAAAIDWGRPSTPPDVATCVRCHVEQEGTAKLGHAAIGGGDCSACHGSRMDESAGAAMASVYYAAAPNRARTSTFPHFTEAHRGAQCTECHGDPKKIGDEVSSPSEGASTCRECHARNRFHWR